MKRADDLDVAGRVVLLRADLNVPRDGEVITDDRRIRASLPTLTALTGRGARVVVCAHLGRPRGSEYAARAAGGPSLRPVAARLSELLGQPVPLAGDVAGSSAAATVAGLAGGGVAMLENVRFELGETSKEDAEREVLAGRLAELADAYVGDGFGAMHRKHASVYDLPRLLPHAAGQLVLAELSVLRQLTTDPPRPYVVVLGGAKASDKLPVIGSLARIADRLLIGGGMAYTFLKAQGHEIGKSLLEADKVDLASQILSDAKAHNIKLLLPVDHVVADKASHDARIQQVGEGRPIPHDMMALDIGPKSVELFSDEIGDARTIVWNGPMGVFEIEAFAKGTKKIARAVADNGAAISIVGGGDSVAAVKAAGVADKITHISTGGGASLEFLEGKKLPGVEALTNK